MAHLDVCARCAAAGPTCCRLEPGQEEHCFPVSEIESHRILEADAGTGAFASEPNTTAFKANLRKLFPGIGQVVDALFPLNKHHLRLATDASGACKLLGPAGCVLPREARPYYCRLFPFWVLGGRLHVFEAASCLVRREHRGQAGLLAALSTTESEVRRLHGRLRMAWGLPPVEGAPRPAEAFNRIRR
jgi:Fe-S-cluster containining protein